MKWHIYEWVIIIVLNLIKKILYQLCTTNSKMWPLQAINRPLRAKLRQNPSIEIDLHCTGHIGYVRYLKGRRSRDVLIFKSLFTI